MLLQRAPQRDWVRAHDTVAVRVCWFAIARIRWRGCVTSVTFATTPSKDSTVHGSNIFCTKPIPMHGTLESHESLIHPLQEKVKFDVVGQVRNTLGKWNCFYTIRNAVIITHITPSTVVLWEQTLQIKAKTDVLSPVANRQFKQAFVMLYSSHECRAHPFSRTISTSSFFASHWCFGLNLS